jgi:hypothetical protein
VAASDNANVSANNSASFAPETEEEKLKRLRRLSKLFQIVGEGVQTQ